MLRCCRPLPVAARRLLPAPLAGVRSRAAPGRGGGRLGRGPQLHAGGVRGLRRVLGRLARGRAAARSTRARFPNLAAFSGDATWYRNATTVADQTTDGGARAAGRATSREGQAARSPRTIRSISSRRSRTAIRSTSSSRPPTSARERLCSQERPSLRSRLRALADDLSVVSAYLLAAGRSRGRIARGRPDVRRLPRRAGVMSRAAGIDARTSRPRRSRTGPVSSSSSCAGIDGDTPKPQLDFLHIALPHFPWQYLPSGQSYDVAGPDPPGLSNEHWSPDRLVAASRAISAICCSWATWTACSAG